MFLFNKKGRNKIKAIFTQYSSADKAALNSYFCDLHKFIFSTTITLSNGAGSIPAATLNIGDALASSGGIWNLAAFYLNAKFGLYAIPLQFADAEELTQHVWGVLSVSQGGGVPSDFDSLLTPTFTDGSTDFLIPYMGGC